MEPVLIDARSPSEFSHAHIPGAVNIPLLDDEHRRIVGTTYKQKGRNEAVLAGFELVGPRFADIIREAQKVAPKKHVTVYCWRGGMRSAITGWLLQTAGFSVTIRKGGYKAYRQTVLESFQQPRKVIVIGGKTGSGKTEILHQLESLGEQVVDLEGLAHHKGSAFGAIGQPPQPSNEHFENLLFERLQKMDFERPVWLENESRSIGRLKIPEGLFELMRKATVLEADVSVKMRMKRIVAEYGVFDRAELEEATLRLSKKLGGQHVKTAVEALRAGDLEKWLQVLFVYYDKTYQHGNDQREPSSIHRLIWNDAESIGEFVDRLRRFVQTL
ncbi:MAG: hypothetical protein RL021_2260 [Bacteroidota bacterium]